jgi:hypothetical protein
MVKEAARLPIAKVYGTYLRYRSVNDVAFPALGHGEP